MYLYLLLTSEIDERFAFRMNIRLKDDACKNSQQVFVPYMIINITRDINFACGHLQFLEDG